MSIFQNTDKETIGKFLRGKREEVGLSQNEVAAKLDYKSSQIISSYEKGERFPPSEKVISLLKILKISDQDFLEVICESDLQNFSKLFDKKIVL